MFVRRLTGQHHFYRMLTKREWDDPLAGTAAARMGGRFNRPGQNAIYLSRYEHMAKEELRPSRRDTLPIFARRASIVVCDLKVCDMTKDYGTSREWRPDRPESVRFAESQWLREYLLERRTPKTWLVADTARKLGADGILYPTKMGAQQTRLVVFDPKMLPPGTISWHYLVAYT